MVSPFSCENNCQRRRGHKLYMIDGVEGAWHFCRVVTYHHILQSSGVSPHVPRGHRPGRQSAADLPPLMAALSFCRLGMVESWPFNPTFHVRPLFKLFSRG